MTSKLRFIPLVLALGLVAMMIPGASAENSAAQTDDDDVVDTFSVPTRVSMDWKERKTKFVGEVSIGSPGLSLDEGGCLTDGRTVKLYKYQDGDPVKKSSTFSDETGFFSFNFDKDLKGKWEARVSPYTFADRYADLVACSGAKTTLKL